MKTIIQTTTTFFAAIIVLGAINALSQQDGTQIQAQDWAGNNDSTNQIVAPTVEYYTNNQVADTTIQQYRVTQQSVVIKPAATMQNGPRIERRPPTTFLQNDPWIQQDHLWDITPDVEPSTSPGHKE
jgi:hypothetical protein